MNQFQVVGITIRHHANGKGSALTGNSIVVELEDGMFGSLERDLTRREHTTVASLLWLIDGSSLIVVGTDTIRESHLAASGLLCPELFRGLGIGERLEERKCVGITHDNRVGISIVAASGCALGRYTIIFHCLLLGIDSLCVRSTGTMVTHDTIVLIFYIIGKGCGINISSMNTCLRCSPRELHKTTSVNQSQVDRLSRNVNTHPHTALSRNTIAVGIVGIDTVRIHAVGHIGVAECQFCSQFGILKDFHTSHTTINGYGVDTVDGITIEVGGRHIEGEVDNLHSVGTRSYCQVRHGIRSGEETAFGHQNIIEVEVVLIGIALSMEANVIESFFFNLEDTLVGSLLIILYFCCRDEQLSHGSRRLVCTHRHRHLLLAYQSTVGIEAEVIEMSRQQVKRRSDNPVVGSITLIKLIVDVALSIIPVACFPCRTIFVGINDSEHIGNNALVFEILTVWNLLCHAVCPVVGEGTLATNGVVVCYHLVPVVDELSRGKHLREPAFLESLCHCHLFGIAHYGVVEIGSVDIATIDTGCRCQPREQNLILFSTIAQDNGARSLRCIVAHIFYLSHLRTIAKEIVGTHIEGVVA